MKKLLFLCVVATHLNSYSQQTKQSAIDSMMKALPLIKIDTVRAEAYNKIASKYLKIDSAKALSYSSRALSLSKEIQWRRGIARSYITIANIHKSFFNYDKAIRFYKISLKYSTDKATQSNIFGAMGEVYLFQSKFTDALDYFHRALKLDEALGDYDGIGKSAINIAMIYISMEENEKALQYLNIAIKNKNPSDKSYIMTVYRNMAVVYNAMGKYHLALEYFNKCLAPEVMPQDNDLKASILSDIALVYFDTQDFNKAISYSKRSLKIARLGSEDKQNSAFSYGIIGDAYIEMARKDQRQFSLLDSSVYYLKKAVKLHKELQNTRGLFDDYSSLTEVFKLKSDFKTAFEMLEQSYVYKDSIYNSDNKETLKNLEDKRTIELRDKEIKINNLKLEAEERQQWFLIAGLALLSIIGMLLFYQSRIRKRNNDGLQKLNSELDHANKVKARFFSILNHDLRSPVANLIHFLHLQKESPEMLTEESKARMENKTISSAENLLESMEDILLWSKGQMENFSPEPKDIAVDTLFDDIKKHFTSTENVHISFENPENLTLFTDENYVKTILRNLTGNAIKALENTKDAAIILKAWNDNDNKYISVSDNGPGGTQEQFRALYDENEVVGIKTGLGLHLIRDLAKAINCKIDVKTAPGTGTIFTLLFP